MSRPKRVLVTGAAGFIGSTLAGQLLAEGRQVVGLDNLDPYYPLAMKRRNLAALERSPAFRFVHGDVRDRGALEQALGGGEAPEAVVHLAALAGVRPSLERPAEYADVNVVGTTRLLEACVRAGIERVVFASSSSVYGERADGEPFRESDAVDRPISPYAATKRAGELLAHSFHHAHGLRVVCARIFTAYGPRQRPDLAVRAFAERIRRGEPIPVFGDGKNQRDFTYVDDLVDGLTRALDSGLAFEILNLGAGRTVTVLQVVELLERVLGRTARIEWLPRQTGDVSRTWADIGAARAKLGYAPRTSLAEGIGRFVEWLEAES
jgi:UDP-glucuronate 4-epimerase